MFLTTCTDRQTEATQVVIDGECQFYLKSKTVETIVNELSRFLSQTRTAGDISIILYNDSIFVESAVNRNRKLKRSMLLLKL
jgi:predicted transcriptional regulator